MEAQLTTSASDTAESLDRLSSQVDAASTSSQAEFLQKEGARRWPTYIRRAHELLNLVLDFMQANADNPDSAPVDEVQLYHTLYEVINQVVGGVQLAFQASTSDNARTDEGNAALRAAFLSTAIVLARLAQASSETPLRHEDFTEQATAAMVLSCRHSTESFVHDIVSRVKWLEEGIDGQTVDYRSQWRLPLLAGLHKRLNATFQTQEASPGAMFERSWTMYAEDMAEALWRPVGDATSESSPIRGSTLNPTDRTLFKGSSGQMWQIFSTNVLTKPLFLMFSTHKTDSKAVATQEECQPCRKLTDIVLAKYREFEARMQQKMSQYSDGEDTVRDHEVNNAFFGWQLTHEQEQAQRGHEKWPELYRDSSDFKELKDLAKLACLEYLQEMYDTDLTPLDLAQLELSIWASVTMPRQKTGQQQSGQKMTSPTMGLAYHDHPLALLSGVFYADAGGEEVSARTPTVFADPRGTTPFRYTRPTRSDNQEGPPDSSQQSSVPEERLEPTAPFHRLAYAHASNGLAMIFPSWLVHGVAPHDGSKARVTFAFNLHTLHGTTLSSWAKTTL